MSLHEATPAHATTPGMRVLEERIRAAHVPAARAGNLRLATWNIRELGKHPRLEESIHLIARILRSFDLIAIIELHDDLGDMRRILHVLGPKWEIVFSDYLADAAGNRERVGFVFNRDRVTFTGFAASAGEPRHATGERFAESIPWWRPPYMASFAAGRFEFLLVGAHVRWGENAKARRGEIAALAKWLRLRAKEKFFGAQNIIVAGDFNVQLDGADGGLVLAPGLTRDVTTDLEGTKRYDQIMCEPSEVQRFTGRAGNIDFCAGDLHALVPHRRLTKTELTLQLSDHLPLWVEAHIST